MFSTAFGDYTLICQDDGLPDLAGEFFRLARIADCFDLSGSEGRSAFIAIRRDEEWPFLVIAQRYEPAGPGFTPGALLVQEPARLFVGAGTRLLAYDLSAPSRLWEDYADGGFHEWRRHGDTVLMSAELELSAWTVDGRKLWTTMVDPPWSYRVSGGRVAVERLEGRLEFDLIGGPSRPDGDRSST